MITHYFRTLKDSELKQVEAVRSGVWTHVVEPTEAELAQVVKDFVLDEAIVEDIQDFFEVPRMERSHGASYFFTRYPFGQSKEDIETAPLLIVMGESFVLTIAQREVPGFKPFIDGREEIFTTQKTKLFITIMATVTKAYERQLVRTRRAVQKDRTQLRSIGPKEIARLVQYEHELNDLLAAVVPTNAWLQQVTKSNSMQLFNEDVELMEDLMIANAQLIESSRSVLRTIQNVRSATEAILTSNLNVTIKTLTVITILLTIPTLVSSLFGMNVVVPLGEHMHAFWLIITLILASVSMLVWYFKRINWL